MISNKLEISLFLFLVREKLCKYKSFTAETGVVWRNGQKVYLGFELEV